MKIFVRFGHSNKCQGASGYLNEVSVIRQYAPWVAQILYYAGHEVRTFNPDTFYEDYPNCNAELNGGINEANACGADLFVSCHANASGGTGTEVLCRQNDSLGKTIGNNVNSSVSNLLEISNRGLKHPTDKGELNYTNMPAVILEPFFVDNQTDCDAYNTVGGENLGKAIANAILQSI